MSLVVELRRAYRDLNKSYQQTWPLVLKAQAAVAEAQEAFLAQTLTMYRVEPIDGMDLETQMLEATQAFATFEAAGEVYSRAVEKLARVEQAAQRLLELRDDMYRALVEAEKAA